MLVRIITQLWYVKCHQTYHQYYGKTNSYHWGGIVQLHRYIMDDTIQYDTIKQIRLCRFMRGCRRTNLYIT